MHWDGTVSVGNVATFIGIIATVIVAFYRFTLTQAKHSLEATAAINNLAAITDRLEKAVATQNGRLTTVEIAMAVDKKVEARLASMGHLNH